MSQEKLVYLKELESCKRDNGKLVKQCELYSEHYQNLQLELEKVMQKLQIKVSECQEWEKKYEESDLEFKKMETLISKTLEEQQKELFSQSQSLNSLKDKQIKDLEHSLHSQFKQQMQQFQDKVTQLSSELSTSKRQNKEVTIEIVS